MFDWNRRRCHIYALLGYAAVAVVFTWPLVPNISTHLTGSPAGDTGVYVWNQWVFRHELLDNHHSPYFTDKIFSLSGRANLSLHNYTAFQDLVALPFISSFGVVTTFNLVYLLMTVLTGYATFLLARHVTGASVEAWLGGLLFAWSPILVTRGGAHFSLVAAAPLAVFLLLLLRAAERQRIRDAVALGATCWWAASTDAYYAVYCVLIATVFMLGRTMTIQRQVRRRRLRAVPWTLDVLLFCVAGLVLSMAVSGGWQLTLLGRVASMRSLYTPMLVLTLLACIRVAWSYRANLTPFDMGVALRVIRLASAAAVVATAMLSPVLYAVGVRIAEGHWDTDRIFWRSSPHGIDIVSFVLPNPNHILAPAALREWLTGPSADRYFENVASLTWIAPIVMFIAWRNGWRIPRFWAGLGLVFGALALGPFVHAFGMNTHVPGPWAFLRYVPIVGLARTPGRFSIVLMLVVAILFAVALSWLARRWPERRRSLILASAALLIFELLPAPRPLYSAAIPRIYQYIAGAPDDVRVLELPSGVRDGTKSVGNFSARTQFFQTVHGKRLIGGYLSRVSRRHVADVRRDPMVDALIWLSEGRSIDASRRQSLVEAGPSFIRRANVGFVVIDSDRTPDALREFAIQAFALQLVDRDDVFELYAPVQRPPAAELSQAEPLH
jgi:hypothetical protein